MGGGHILVDQNPTAGFPVRRQPDHPLLGAVCRPLLPGQVRRTTVCVCADVNSCGCMVGEMTVSQDINFSLFITHYPPPGAPDPGQRPRFAAYLSFWGKVH